MDVGETEGQEKMQQYSQQLQEGQTFNCPLLHVRELMIRGSLARISSIRAGAGGWVEKDGWDHQRTCPREHEATSAGSQAAVKP